MMQKQLLSLLVSLALSSVAAAQQSAPIANPEHPAAQTTPAPAPQHVQRSRPANNEEIPDDIWSTIASPFDPIGGAQNFMQQAPQMPMMQQQPQQPIRYPAPAIPYEMPPQEKQIAAYPEEYWNCLLNNLQGLGSDVAAKLITRACQKKYPKR